LSGMSDMAQMKDNVKTFSSGEPLTEAERDKLYAVAETMKNSVPCTGCRYCCDGCPQGLDIPLLLATYNEARVATSINVGMRIEALPEEKRPAACISCGKCAQVCPQQIDVPLALKDFSSILTKMPSWAELCRQRDEEAKRDRERKK